MFCGYLEAQSRLYRSLLGKLQQNSGIRMRYIEDDNDFINFVNGALSGYHPENEDDRHPQLTIQGQIE